MPENLTTRSGARSTSYAAAMIWLLLPGGWAVVRGRRPGKWFNYGLIAAVALAVAALFLHWLPLLPQRNAHWIALLLPLHLGLLLGFTNVGGLPVRRRAGTMPA